MRTSLELVTTCADCHAVKTLLVAQISRASGQIESNLRSCSARSKSWQADWREQIHPGDGEDFPEFDIRSGRALQDHHGAGSRLFIAL